MASYVGCRWENIGRFYIDHFSIMRALDNSDRAGYIHRHLYSCSLSIWSGDDETALDQNNQVFPFREVAFIIDKVVLSKWNGRIILPSHEQIEWNPDDPKIYWKGCHVPQTNTQFLYRRWEIDQDPTKLYFDRNAAPMWLEQQDLVDRQLDEALPFHNQVDEKILSYVRAYQVEGRDQDEAERMGFPIDVCSMVRAERSCGVVRQLKIGKNGTSEDIAKELLMDILQGIKETSNRYNYKDRMDKVFSFDFSLKEEELKEGVFSAVYSMTGSVNSICEEWERNEEKAKKEKEEAKTNNVAG